MRRRQFLLSGSLGSLIACGLVSLSGQAQTIPLTVSAAASLQDALKEIQPLYQQEQPTVEITFNFGSSGSLQQQIEQGALVDLFISAAAGQMNALQEKGLILTETRTDLVSNQLVLITPVTGPQIDAVEDLLQPVIERIALGEPSSVPAGTYAQQALESLGLFNDLKAKFVYGKDVRQVLSYVEAAEVQVGLVYQTDVNRSHRVKVAMGMDPATHAPIVYLMAVMGDSQNPEAAKAFAQFLQADAAQAVFKNFGFN
jgi:molybdate transport system substrate-binding protein